MEELMTIKQLAQILSIAQQTIRNKLSDGTWPIEPIRVGRCLRWRPEALERFLSDQGFGTGSERR